jgi:hypothetical protein
MKSFKKKLWFHTKNRMEFMNIMSSHHGNASTISQGTTSIAVDKSSVISYIYRRKERGKK